MTVTSVPGARLRLAAAASLMTLAAACATVEEVPPPVAAMPVMQWDHVAAAQGEDWTEATLTALQQEGADLLQIVPQDIGTWCPGYATASEDDRAAFWAGLLSSLARYESTWNPDAVGGGGQWFGLVQIAPATARGYGCAAQSGNALRDGAANLACAVRIASHTVMRDRVVAAGGRGFAADWGPFHRASARQSMAAWVSSQSYCQLP